MWLESSHELLVSDVRAHSFSHCCSFWTVTAKGIGLDTYEIVLDTFEHSRTTLVSTVWRYYFVNEVGDQLSPFVCVLSHPSVSVNLFGSQRPEHGPLRVRDRTMVL